MWIIPFSSWNAWTEKWKCNVRALIRTNSLARQRALIRRVFPGRNRQKLNWTGVALLEDFPMFPT